MRLGIFGAGKLSAAVRSVIASEAEGGALGGLEPIEIAWVVDRDEAPPSAVDLALDASVAGAVAEHLSWALDTGVDLVIGTTGWDGTILGAAEAAGPDLPCGILVAPNFSLGVAFMRRAALALGRFAALDSQADLGLLERHHSAKADAPSGTAKLLALALAEACPRYEGWEASPAAGRGIPVASLRLSREVGYHEMRLESPFETIVFSHEAKGRAIFARGAVAALRWIRGRKGVYAFDDMAAEIIDPLFAPARGLAQGGQVERHQ